MTENDDDRAVRARRRTIVVSGLICVVGCIILETWMVKSQGRKTTHHAERLDGNKEGAQDNCEQFGHVWKWDDNHLLLKDWGSRVSEPYNAVCSVNNERGEKGPGLDRNTIVEIVRGGQVVYSWHAHKYSAFLIADDVLYYLIFSPLSNGAELIAVDLRATKRIWATKVKGLGDISHTTYWNRIQLELSQQTVTVYGWEAAGRYIEVISIRDGSRLHHEQCWGDSNQPF